MLLGNRGGHAGWQVVSVDLYAFAGSNPALSIEIAGWSSQVARRAHNPEAVGSNPTPATTFLPQVIGSIIWGLFFVCHIMPPILQCSGDIM